jgi:hypothetical protein
MVFPFMGKPEGPLLLQIVEDLASRGPDGELGVLALSWQEVPTSIAYTGFAYLGGSAVSRRLNAPALLQARKTDDLKGLRLKFRFRGQKSGSESPAEIKVGCRLEPNLPNSYNKRLGMGKLIATDAWGVYDASLADGDNQEAFLRALAEEKPTSFKIVWAQAGAIKDYQAGDTLLLDDIVISQSPSEE